MAYYDTTEYVAERDAAEADRSELLSEARREAALDDIQITWVRRKAVDIPVTTEDFMRASRPTAPSMFEW